MPLNTRGPTTSTGSTNTLAAFQFEMVDLELEQAFRRAIQIRQLEMLRCRRYWAGFFSSARSLVASLLVNFE
eukprot:m.277525 g.277525  ORF g.277525 m.277525 type:complete len:72 (-) comp16149_c0_seq2:95-310(-)